MFFVCVFQLSQSVGREYTNIKYATQAHNASLHKMPAPAIPAVFSHARDKAPAKYVSNVCLLSTDRLTDRRTDRLGT